MVEPPPEESFNVLFVDDDPSDAALSRLQLPSAPGLHVDYAAATADAARMMAEREWDLVAVDPNTVGGFEFLKQIKTLNRYSSTLVVVRSNCPEAIRMAVQCRIECLMFKPVNLEHFTDQVLQLAAEARRRRQRQQRRVLAIGAHPDDVEIGCGGALAKHRAEGDVVRILTLSRGAAGGDTKARTHEARNAAALLGARVEFGNFTDTLISEGTQTIELIEAAIREFRPTHVYTHAAEDTHQDHRAVHAATLVAARGVPNVYCYQAPSSTVDFRPNFFIDITPFMENKLRAIRAYDSQVNRSPLLRDDVILAAARYWGRYAGHVLAEPMTVVRQRDSALDSMESDAGSARQSESAAAE
jgi:LmbE family N-acetylglucosaminyl deacetylase